MSVKYNRPIYSKSNRGFESSIEVEPKGARPFLVVAWYRPPAEPVETFTKLEKNLDFFDRENKEIPILGDTNCDLLKVSSPEMDSNLAGNSLHMSNIYDLFGFRQMINEPTRETLDTSTLIDHVATNTPANIVDSGVLKISLSDHYLVFCIRKFRGFIQRQPKLIRSRRMKNFVYESFLFDLGQIDWDGIVRNSGNVHDAVQQWSTTLSLVIEMHAPLQDMRVSNKYSPWLNSDFRKLSRQRDRIKTAAVKRKSTILMDAYKQLRNKANILNKNLKREYFSKKLAACKGDLKQSWKTINLLLNKRSKTTNIEALKVNEQEINKDHDIANSMNNYFCSVGKSLSDKIPAQSNPLLSHQYDITNFSNGREPFKFVAIDKRTIEKALNKIKTSHGSGVDNIASYFLKVAFPVISDSLCDILNLSLSSGIFPDSWKVARVAPIFKEGPTDERSNYRPISVLPAVSRLFEKLVYDQLYRYLDENELICLQQSGFRSLHSVVTCLLKCTNDWYVNIDKGKYTAMIFIDFKKAFDTVDHGILLDKMKFYGICGLEHDWFRSYLNNRKQFCKVNGVPSDIKDIDVGVPQGSCFGPLLFLLYINDLPFALKKAETNMYADDTMISYSSKTLDELHMVLNAELVNIEKWLQCNKLSLNVVKTQAMVVGSMQNVNKMAVQPTLSPVFHVGGTDIDLVNKVKYLGLHIDNSLTWKCQIENIKGKVSRAIGLLKYCKNFVSMETLNDIYRSIVEPHLNYCCSVWGCSGITRIESPQKLQNRAARIVTGSSYDAPSVPLRKELGWLSVKEMIVKETSTMMYKSLNDLAPQYLSDLFARLSDFHTRELRNTKNDLAVPLMRTVSGQKAFSYRGTKVWNKFNNNIKEAPSVYSFKSRLRQLGYENL